MIFNIVEMIYGSRVFKAAALSKYLLLIGMINWGITGKILLPPFYNKSFTPIIAKLL